jgi:hypothetical protein
VEEATSTTVAPDDYFETRNRFADRLTLEEWNMQSSDPFSAGSLQSIPTVFLKAAYLGPMKVFDAVNQYILIRPSAAFTNGYVGIWYLKNPDDVATGASVIEFPILCLRSWWIKLELYFQTT